MTDEVITEVVEQTPEPQTPQYTEVEQAAIERGWKPKDQYAGDPARWRSAEVFVALDEPLKRIESQSKELKRVREALEALHVHHKKVKESEYTRALKDLQEARKEAFRVGETDQAFAIEDRIEQLKTEKENIVLPDLPQAEQQIAPEFQAWVESNTWYAKNEVMRAAADAIGIRLHGEGFTPKQVLKQVEEEIKKEFPNKFVNEKAQRPNAVEGSSRANTRSTETFDLSQDEVKIMQKIVNSGVMSKEDYIKELKKTRA